MMIPVTVIAGKIQEVFLWNLLVENRSSAPINILYSVCVCVSGDMRWAGIPPTDGHGRMYSIP